MIILTVRTHGQQPWKTDIYRARAHHRASALSAVLPIAIVRTNLSVMIG